VVGYPGKKKQGDVKQATRDGTYNWMRLFKNAEVKELELALEGRTRNGLRRKGSKRRRRLEEFG